MASLAVFDFDRTVVHEDSDATIIERLRRKQPEWESDNQDWTPYMSDVFEHAYSAGFHPSDILDSIASMRPNPGMVELITTLAKKGWKVILLTDANSVFVNHWLKTHDLENAITTVITNRAFWQNGRLYIEPCMRQNVCPKCPSNLCKSLALEKWCGQKKYDNIIYCGDGRNDFCPAVNLPENAVIFPRKGYTMDNLIKKDAASPNPQMKAKVVPWVDGFRILQEVFPENSKLIC
ncbi:pyridoxal phosphate phosphatase PHOSPHO2-like isoform X2 [Aricia agestis]|uniref:pyridoxal phosphate phosphatase PHOSPHO2-like isoform X2 n=1 Tax=Aricia agestis TaxID=91739 RepID=UPI001C20629D|nr:pyridoxal phosphate phosphatase PHOSPHO2-like isoform X2 [Aricia agestis]